MCAPARERTCGVRAYILQGVYQFKDFYMQKDDELFAYLKVNMYFCNQITKNNKYKFLVKFHLLQHGGRKSRL